MRFTWLEEKNQANIKKHGIAFEDAIAVFDGPTVEWDDDRKDYGECRRVAIGFMTDTLMVAVVYVDEENEDDTYHIISARKAESYERQRFEAYLRNRTEP